MFTFNLKVEKVMFKNIWITLEPFEYQHLESKYLSATFTIKVPKGFYTDFASVPRLPTIYALVGNIGHEAAVIHDYLYRIDSIPNLTKDTCDRIFYDALIESGIEEYKANMMYDGVAIGGESSYHQKMVADIL
jgi:hypothetical protein